MCEARLPRARDPLWLYRRWWADVPTRLGPKTCRLYRRKVLDALADTCWHPLEVKNSKIDDYLGDLRPHYAGAVRSALADFFAFLVRRGYRADNPLEKAKVLTRIGRRRMRRALSMDELVQLIVAARCASSNPRYEGEKLAFGILLQYSLGTRPGEMLKLRPGDFSLNGRTSEVMIVDTKTGDDRLVPLGPLAREVLRELIRISPGDGRLIGIGTSHWHTKVRRAALLAGLDPAKCRPYALRHTFATHLREAGIHDRVIMELMGHRDVRALAIYTVPEASEQRQAVEQLGRWR